LHVYGREGFCRENQRERDNFEHSCVEDNIKMALQEVGCGHGLGCSSEQEQVASSCD
jgi:hypothetical protein